MCWQAGHYANEALSSIRTVHAFGLQALMQRQFEKVQPSVTCVVWSFSAWLLFVSCVLVCFVLIGCLLIGWLVGWW